MDEQEELELEQETDETETPDQEQPEVEGDKGQESTTETPEETGAETYIFGDQEEERAPEWVRDLRKSHRRTVQENRELKEKLEALTAPKPKLTPKPKLEQFDYDADQYEQALDQWYEAKRQVDAEESEKNRQKEQEQREWQGKLNEYQEKKKTLKVDDYEDSEALVTEILSVPQQSIVVSYSDNPALMIYALGKNTSKARDLSKIQDPIKFAIALKSLEQELKVKKKTPPPPEKTLSSGSTPKSGGGSDATLERLREEASKTGDFTKVHQYRQRLKAK